MKRKILLILIITLIVCIIVRIIFEYSNTMSKKIYSAEYFKINIIHSSIDFNKNDIDDYTDILLGAKKDAEHHPKYNGAYYKTGYPPDNIGVCTDVIWRAFKNAGYSLRDMVDQDIKARPEYYKNIEEPDSNIDFRRVKNLKVFFEEYATSLTLDINDIAEWQPGDIVIFHNDVHIGIISDKRNKYGYPYVIHNSGQINREEDYLNKSPVTGHYRFDASKIDDSVLVKWN